MLAVGGGPGCPVRNAGCFRRFLPSSGRRRPASRRSPRRSPTGSAPRSSRRTRSRSTAVSRSSRTSPSGRRGSSRSATLAEEMSVGEYAALAHEAIDELVAVNGTAVVAGGTGLYLRAALVDLDASAGARAGRARALEAAYDADPRGRSRAARRARSARAPRSSTRPTGAASCARSSSRRPARRSRRRRGPALVARDAPPDARRRGSRSRRERLEQRIRARAEAMLDARRRRGGAGRRARRGVSRTAEKALGLGELADAARATRRSSASSCRTRRYAAYQRKWMRRIPGIVMIDADRPPDEVADAILEVARAR